MRIADRSQIPDTDRRRTLRLALSLPLYLFRSAEAYPIETKTTNVSTGGFYCFVQQAFSVGEHIRCIMVIQTHDPQHKNEVMSLECQATVLRVESAANDKYGIACRISDYRVIPPVPRSDLTRDSQ